MYLYMYIVLYILYVVHCVIDIGLYCHACVKEMLNCFLSPMLMTKNESCIIQCQSAVRLNICACHIASCLVMDLL